MRSRYTLVLIILTCLSFSCFLGKKDPIEFFQENTGLPLGDDYKVLKMTDTYFTHEGELSLIMTLPDTQIQSWLTGEVPWENISWQRGPVPDSIFNARFGNDQGIGTTIWTNDDGTKRTEYFGPEELISLKENPETYWTSKSRCCFNGRLPYHNGELLIIEPDKSKVWFASWDY